MLDDMTRIKDIGFHYINEELQINLNRIFFKDVYENNNVDIAVDGYLIIEKNIKESTKEETLYKLYRLYKEHGIDFIKKIKTGKFNLLLKDKKLNKIFLATDEFGNLPIYYTIGDPFQFSTNILNLVFGSLDWQAVSQFLKYGYILFDKTQAINIKVLPPHSILEYDISSKKCKLRKYEPIVNISTDVEKLFRRACERLYCDELEYSLGLSGGVDSRFVLSHWKNKDDLTSFTILSDTPDEAELEDIKIAKELTENLPVKKHLTIELKNIEDKLFKEYLDKVNPFDIRKLYGAPSSLAVDEHFIKDKSVAKNLKIRLTGDMAPVISGEFNLLRHPKFLFTLLFGIEFPNVSKTMLDKAITRIPKDALKEYLKPEIYQEITELPIAKRYINVEDYHVYSRTLRWERFGNHLCRNFEIVYPFLDYDLYFSCKRIKDRANNKLYYHLLSKMPSEYKVKVTRYAFPLSYPRRIQFSTMIIKDLKRHLKPGSTHIEEIGGAIKRKPSIYKYMTDSIEEAGICKNIEGLSNQISGGKYGHFFFQLFLLSYWINKMEFLR